jgi:hypothetical protein
MALKIFLLILAVTTSLGELYEEDRNQEYIERGYEWPLPEV